LETGKLITTIFMPGTSGAKDCSFSAPESICCCAAGRSILCYDVRSPRILIQTHTSDSSLSAISCSPDGRFLAYASSDSTVGMFSLRMSCVVRPGLFHTNCVNSCYFQDDCSGFWTAVSDLQVVSFNQNQKVGRVPTKWSASSGRKQEQAK
jgi:WD40 repeat protein